MAKTYRVGVASLVHDHIWSELKAWQALPNVELVAAGDVNAELRDKVRSEFGIQNVYNSWQEMLAAEGTTLDIVQAAAPNNVHADIVEACAAHGIHVVIEKPMAATLAQAKRMVKATAEAGTSLLVSWPTAWMPAFQEMERRILAGEIGEVRYFKYRSAHNGPKEIGCTPYFYEWLYDAEQNGAGALMDYCCYGAVMNARFLGLPIKVTGMRAVLAKDYPLADDNAIITMQYPHAFGVAEASWTQVTYYITPNPVAYGSEGALAIKSGQLIRLKPGLPEEIIDAPALESPRRNAPEYMIHHLETGEPLEGTCSAAVSVIAQEILEAGLRAADSGIAQTLPLEG